MLKGGGQSGVLQSCIRGSWHRARRGFFFGDVGGKLGRQRLILLIEYLVLESDFTLVWVLND